MLTVMSGDIVPVIGGVIVTGLGAVVRKYGINILTDPFMRGFKP